MYMLRRGYSAVGRLPVFDRRDSYRRVDCGGGTDMRAMLVMTCHE
jgi:hypothetical protein